jgi:hypothetical protein
MFNLSFICIKKRTTDVILAVCHTIATTKLGWCEKRAEDVTGDGEVDKMALTFTRELQTVEEKKEDNVRVSNFIAYILYQKLMGGGGGEARGS